MAVTALWIKHLTESPGDEGPATSPAETSGSHQAMLSHRV